MALLLAAIVVAAPQPSTSPSLPPVDEVQREAIAHARLDLRDPIDWRRRARHAAYVPRVQLDFGNRLHDYVNVNVNDNVYVGSSGVVVGPSETNSTCQQYADYSFGVRAVWELGEAVFSRMEIAASAEARALLKERNELLTEVSRRYLAIQQMPQEVRLLKRLAAFNPRPDKAQHEIFLKQLACEESVAMLDGLTGGWFGQSAGDAVLLCAMPTEINKRRAR